MCCQIMNVVYNVTVVLNFSLVTDVIMELDNQKN